MDIKVVPVREAITDEPAWEQCRPPVWPRRTIDGGWTNIPSGQTWRRKVNGKWQYKRDARVTQAP
jgi:hypothetical protein